MSGRREARFTADKLSAETLVAAHNAILATPSLPIRERLKAARLLQQAQDALCGRRRDPALINAAYLMAAIHRWNERVPQHRIAPNEALRMISRHMRSEKSPQAIRVALRRKPYRTFMEQAAQTIGDLDAFNTVWSMKEADMYEAILRESNDTLAMHLRTVSKRTPDTLAPRSRSLRGGRKLRD